MSTSFKKSWCIAAVVLVALAVAGPSVRAEDEGAATETTQAEGSGADLTPLAIELPEPCYMGTPLDYWSDHLEITFKKREPFMAPEGAANVAKDKLVTGSARPSIGKLAMITDGNKSATEESVVELPTGVQHVQVDLGAQHELYAIVVWHFHAEERVYFDTICKVADDKDFTENVVTLWNNDFDNSSGLGVGKNKEYIDNYEGRLIDAHGKKARFVRLYSNGNTSDDMNHYIEIEVYGKPVP